MHEHANQQPDQHIPAEGPRKKTSLREGSIQGGEPLRWWESVVRCDATELPFKRFYADALLVEAVPLVTAKRDERVMMNLTEQKAESARLRDPAAGWGPKMTPDWGEEGFAIEQWFDEGEELEYSDIELFIEEPDRWERAVQWMRSLVDAAGLRIS